jgi:hypothetical protein
MNLLKILNIYNKKIKLLLDEEEKIIMDKCQKLANIEYQDQQENKTIHDGICPKCKSKENIVNKVCHVYGKGSVNGNIFIGISGIVTIDTDEVNHCNNCGNEWKKYKTKAISQTDILRVAFNYLAQIYKDPEERRHSWKLEAILVFKDISAEAIYRLRVKQKKVLHSNTKLQLTFYRLKKNYKSIYD